MGMGRAMWERLRSGARSARNIGQCARLDVPWARWWPARWLREAVYSFVLGPLMRLYVRRRVLGGERFDELEPPVILVSNHQSHIDTPQILTALPRKWRQRTAVAAAADYFYCNRLVAAIVSLAFNTVPIERRGRGLDRDAKRHLDRVLRQRWNLLIYPEGTRSRNGEVGRLRTGAAAIAVEHGLKIVPIEVEGTHSAMPPGRSWPRRVRRGWRSTRHPVTVRFGAPIVPLPGEDRHDVTARLRAFYGQEPAPIGEAAPPPAREPVAASL
jgi:1-acyl-sn-glycerol-3-phosphate acyltransferase